MASETSRSLNTFRFPNGTCIAQAQPLGQVSVNLASPAIAVMTDLAEVRAATVHPDTDLDVVDLQALMRATVGDALATLAQFGRPHMLVVEAASQQGPARIRGVVSHAQIERQLGHAAPIHEVAQTFAEVEHALA